MKIYLIRHGETDWNLEGRLQGREDIPLNEKGREQAAFSGRALRDSNIRLVLTSPLSRARETAEIIAEIIGVNHVFIEEGIIERDFGSLSGQTYDREKHFDTFGTEKDMEPLEVLKKRLLQCIRGWAEETNEGNILMISHGAAINAVISSLTGGEMGSGKTRLKNACISVIEYKDRELILERYNIAAEDFVENNCDTRRI